MGDDKKNEKKLIAFENKVLRKIFGPVNKGGIFEIRNKQRTERNFTRTCSSHKKQMS